MTDIKPKIKVTDVLSVEYHGTGYSTGSIDIEFAVYELAIYVEVEMYSASFDPSEVVPSTHTVHQIIDADSNHVELDFDVSDAVAQCFEIDKTIYDQYSQACYESAQKDADDYAIDQYEESKFYA